MPAAAAATKDDDKAKSESKPEPPKFAFGVPAAAAADADKGKAEDKPAAEAPKGAFTFSMPKMATPDSKTGAALSFADLAKQSGGSSGFGAVSGGSGFSFGMPVAKEAPKPTAIFGAKKDDDEEGEV